MRVTLAGKGIVTRTSPFSTRLEKSPASSPIAVRWRAMMAVRAGSRRRRRPTFWASGQAYSFTVQN
jgi:hypothetical protein